MEMLRTNEIQTLTHLNAMTPKTGMMASPAKFSSSRFPIG